MYRISFIDMKERWKVPYVECGSGFSDPSFPRLIKEKKRKPQYSHRSVSAWKRRFPLCRNIGDRSRCGKCADCESTWLPECRQRSNIVHKDGNTGTVAVVPSLKRLSTRRALGWGRVGRPVTTYCEGLSLWKARRDFLPLTPENPPRVSSRESRSFASVAICNPLFAERHRVSFANESAHIARYRHTRASDSVSRGVLSGIGSFVPLP